MGCAVQTQPLGPERIPKQSVYHTLKKDYKTYELAAQGQLPEDLQGGAAGAGELFSASGFFEA